MQVELTDLGALSSDETKGKYDHASKDYENVKALMSEILDYLNKKDWAMTKVLIDGRHQQWLK
jgi:hypothetical protein